MSEKQKTVSVYREQGNDPNGVTIGGYLLGVVNHNVPEDVAKELVTKNFRIVAKDFDPKKPQPQIGENTGDAGEAKPEQTNEQKTAKK